MGNVCLFYHKQRSRKLAGCLFYLYIFFFVFSYFSSRKPKNKQISKTNRFRVMNSGTQFHCLSKPYVFKTISHNNTYIHHAVCVSHYSYEKYKTCFFFIHKKDKLEGERNYFVLNIEAHLHFYGTRFTIILCFFPWFLIKIIMIRAWFFVLCKTCYCWVFT